MGFFGPTKVPKSTVSELEGRTTQKVTSWNASKKTWAHIMSLSDGCQGTVSQFGVGYGANPSTGYLPNYERPDIQIDKIEVRRLGDYGTTKKVTVTLRAFTLDQLNNIAKCYLIPGMSIRVQFGWTQSVSGAKSIGPNTTVLSDVNFFAYVLKTQESYSNYDGNQGRLVSYNITSESDQTWLITLEMTGIGAMLEDIKINNHSNACACDSDTEGNPQPPNGTDTKKSQALSNLSSGLKSLIDDAQTFSERVQYLRGLDGSGDLYGYSAKIVERTAEGAPAGETFLGGLGNTVNTTLSFVSELVNAGPVAPIPTAQVVAARDEYYISYRSLQILINELSIKNSPNDKPPFSLNSDNIEIKVPEFGTISDNGDESGYIIFCADPRVALIPYSPAGDYQPELSQGSPTTPYKDNTTLVLNNILFNIKYLRGVLEAMDKDDNVLTFLQRIFNDLNYNCGSLWEFAFVDSVSSTGVENLKNIKSGTVIATVDIKSMFYANDLVYTFPAKAAKSNVRSVKMDLKLTEAMKSQALYGGGFARPTGRLGCGDTMKVFTRLSGKNLADSRENQLRAVYGSFIDDLVSQIKGTGYSQAEVEGTVRTQASAANIPVGEWADLVNIISGANQGSCGPAKSNCKPEKQSKFIDRLKAFKEAITDDTVGAIRGDIVRQVADAVGTDYCLNSIIPMEFGVTVDGVGGFKFGQAIDCDRFPEKYRKYFYYQVTAAEQSVTVEDWTTNITTVARLKAR